LFARSTRMDIVYLGILLAFFALTAGGLVGLCEKV
jgi:hypothetical protein